MNNTSKISKIKGTTLWKPALCLSVVLLQWAIWSHHGLDMASAPYHEPKAEESVMSAGYSDLEPHGVQSESRLETTADTGPDFEFKREKKQTRSLSTNDLCRQLQDWPLPGCSLG